MPEKYIELEIKDNIATVNLARVGALNALNFEFSEQIVDTFRLLGGRDDVRAIILKSKAKIFCAGLDLKEAQSNFGSTAKSAIEMLDRAKPFLDSCNAMEECPKPVIAAVHGKCIGGGLDLIAACDIRICTEDAIFCLKEAAVAIVADMGVLQRLPLIIGQGFTREMAFTAAEYSARDAVRMGLVNSVYPDMEAMDTAARTLATQIAANGPLGIRCTKEVLNYSRYANVQEGTSLAVHKNMVLFRSNDFRETIKAFLEKRAPQYKGE